MEVITLAEGNGIEFVTASPSTRLGWWLSEHRPDIAAMSRKESLDVLNAFTGLNVQPSDLFQEACARFLEKLECTES